MTVENATTEATGEPGMHSEVKVLPGVDEAAGAAVWTEVEAGAGPVGVVLAALVKAITPDAKVFKAHLLELGYMFGQGELRTPHNHPSTPYLYRQKLETFDQPESRLHVCNGTAERPCGHTFGHLPRDQWPLHEKEVCPKCKLTRFEGEAGKFMRDSVGADQFDNPYAVRLSLGIDWVKITETQSVEIIVLQVMDVPTKYMSKDETWAIVGVILGADKSKFVEGYVNQLLVDLRDSLDESKRDCWVYLHAPKGYRGANEATKIRLYPMLASVVADTPARVEVRALARVQARVRAWLHHKVIRVGMLIALKGVMRRQRVVVMRLVEELLGPDIGCWGRPIVTKYLKYVQAKWLHVVPIAHAFLFGVVKHHMQWLFSKSGRFSKRQGNDKESPRETMIKRFKDMHFPVTFGRRLKHTEDFTGWIMDDFMHFVRYGWQYVFRDIVTEENGHLPIWKALVKAVLHYLTSEGDPQRSPDKTPEAEALYEARLKAGMDEGADAIHTYAYESQARQPSPAQPSPAQPSPAQPSPAQPSPAQPSPAQPSPAQPSPAQPSPAQPSPAQPSPAQPSPAQPSPAQPSPAQPSPAQPSPAQPSPAQPSPAQPSPAQPSPAQPSPAQPSPAQPSPAQPSPAQPYSPTLHFLPR
ncbi:hypothetical protein V8C86DRAFT_3092334 [Haematococcus lacustris]